MATRQEAATGEGAARTVDDRRETVSLIGSDKVEGTAVYGADADLHQVKVS
jgi:hypothetical protein